MSEEEVSPFNYAFVRFSSHDRETLPGLKSDFTISLKEKFSMQKIKSVQICRATIPNVFYNISDEKGNRTIEIQQDGETAVEVTVPEGQYTITTYITALKTAIDAVLTGGSTVAIVQDVDTQLLTFTFSGGTNPNTALNSPSVSNIEGYYAIGFNSSVAEASSWTATYIPNLRGYSDVYLHCKKMIDMKYYDGDFGSIGAFAQVNFSDVQFGATGHYQSGNSDMDTIYFDKAINLAQTLRIVLRDVNGNFLDTGGSDIDFVLKVGFY